jgi:gliding motility-associated-like protein
VKRLPIGFQVLFVLSFLLFLFRSENVFAQNSRLVETSESIYEHWFYALDNIRQNPITDKQDFDVFTRFCAASIDSLRGDFLRRIGSHEITLDNVKSYEDTLSKKLTVLYEKYLSIKKEFPSSVAEFTRKDKPLFLTAPCNAACNNIDFETGDLSGWNAYYGDNASGASTNITNITGGPAGAVTEAANDPLTSTIGFYNSQVGPNSSPDYQVSITSGSRGDALVPSVPVVSPFGGHHSVMLGDSTLRNSGVAILSQTFLVSTSNANFTYQYAVFLGNPGHTYYQQPFFKIFFIDQVGDTIPFCGEYTVVSGHGTQGFDSITYNDLLLNETYTMYYKNWTTVNVPLKKYIGQCITVVFESGDCSPGGHFGYAYIDASCSPLEVLSSSQFFCGQDSITLSGPAGESAYQWTGPTGGIISNNNTRNIQIDSAGTYTLVITPVTGTSCNDTLTINIGKKPGPPPHPDFSADTVCVGMATSFTNKSNPINGGAFDWDFYNIGSYQDSTTNPTWTYNSQGTYTVKLHEEVNGCGMDTLITVVVDGPITASFTDNSVCPKDTVFFTNTSVGPTSYEWNFGDPASGIQNSSTLTSPHHVYDSTGTYNVTLIGKNHSCIDTITESVVIFPGGINTLISPEKICSGNSVAITATGGAHYLWNTGATTATINVNPGTTAAYYCIIRNSYGCLDTAFDVVEVNPLPILTVCCDTSLTPAQSTQLEANGTGTFLWTPSYGLNCYSCNDPVASPPFTTIYTVVATSDSGCSVSRTVTIDVSCGEIFVPNVFSPNEDHNNILFVRSPCIKQLVFFMVFDRWGNMVFESRSLDIGWDGHHNGLAMDMGTYIWRLKAVLIDGETVEKKGDVTLVR